MAKKLQSVQEFPPYKVPDFSLPVAVAEKDGVQHDMRSLKDFRGQWQLLFVYPADNTPTCTQEAVAFDAAQADFSALDCAITGLSKDDLKSHERFITKHNLTIPLLSDTETTLISALGSWGEKSLYGRKYMGTDRSTFLIDPEGLIRAEWRKVRFKGHVEAVLEALKTLRRA
ncbi:peroxiredoxin [Asticcacaulis tiandongensis]|uniref:peroxiredoxin n=1 Tax=Asticcacaulis tiandongensis TaxID=2565365 RepID=UPI00112B679B|nr:peroxiredoxin [Asticcacaulis tiandongensis]